MTSTIQSAPVVGASSHESDSPSDPSSSSSTNEALDPEPEPEPQQTQQPAETPCAAPAPIAKTVTLPLVDPQATASTGVGARKPALHALDGGLMHRDKMADALVVTSEGRDQPEAQSGERSRAANAEPDLGRSGQQPALVPDTQAPGQEETRQEETRQDNTRQDRTSPEVTSPEVTSPEKLAEAPMPLAASLGSDERQPLSDRAPGSDSKPKSERVAASAGKNPGTNATGTRASGTNSVGAGSVGAESANSGSVGAESASAESVAAGSGRAGITGANLPPKLQAGLRALGRRLARLFAGLPRPEVRWRRADSEPDLEREPEQDAQAKETATLANAAELLLLANIRALRTARVEDVRVPRADITFITNDMNLDDIVAKAKEAGHSRFPVMGEDQDEVLGMIHIKDLLWGDVDPKQFRVQDFMRDVLFVAPSMPVLQLLQDMQVKRHHMALIVDEFGGIDGLVTIEDLVEEIVGDISDEYDTDREPALVPQADGTWIIDARYRIDELEELIGGFLTEDEQDEDIDTLGGLLTHIAGRVPTRNELIEHASGMRFQVVDADPRRIKRLRMRARSLAGAKGLMNQALTQETAP